MPKRKINLAFRRKGAKQSQPSVFISYRRADSEGQAGRLYDALAQTFGKSQVFRDVYNIGAGEDFEEVIRDNLSQTTVFIALIGPNWHGPRNWLYPSRIHNKGDFVRRELEMAREACIPVLPVLVADALLPKAKSLPTSIRFLTTLNASSLRDARWDDDTAALVRNIEAAHAKGRTNPKVEPAPTDRGFRRWQSRYPLKFWFIRLTLVGLILAGTFLGLRTCFKPRFAITSEFGFVRQTRDINGAGFWMVHAPQGVQTASPISIALYVRYTNLQSVASMIDSYAVEVRDRNNVWIKLSRVSGKDGIVYSATDLSKALRVNMGEGAFDRLLENRNIQPNETVRGWIFLELPKDIIVDNRDKWRFTMRDALGVETTEPMDQLTLQEGQDRSVQEQRFATILPPVDISGLPRRFYTDTQRR